MGPLDLTEIFCDVDDFCQLFNAEWEKSLVGEGVKRRHRQASLCRSEMMSIALGFQISGFLTFKAYYLALLFYHKKDFPGLVSYNRFVEWMPRLLIPLMTYLHSRRGPNTGLSFVDSTSIVVCHNKRIRRNKVFKDLAQRGKTTMGWFFGFKLHLMVNEQGDLLNFQLTPGNVDDRQVVPDLSKNLTGLLFGDKGYISQKLFEKLLAQGLQLVTGIRDKMKNKLMPLLHKILLRKRSVIETINDQLKNTFQIEHTRHRSPTNFLVNILTALLAYTHQEKRPSIRLNIQPLQQEIPTLMLAA